MKLKVMTWNVQNLFLPGMPSGPATPADLDVKVQNLADTILDLDPDILAVQEIGTPETFQMLQDRLGGAYPNGELSKEPDGRGIRVGFLSKAGFAFDQAQDIVDLAPNATLERKEDDGTVITRMRRGALWVRVTVDGKTINLITTHLKSKLLTFPGGNHSTDDEDVRAKTATLALAERAQEAFTLRTKTNELLLADNDEAVILLGDLNDLPDAASTQVLYGPDGSQPDGDKNNGGVGFNAKDKGDKMRLFNLGRLIPAETRFSRIHNGVPELIDHILVSEELVPFDAVAKKRKLPVVESHPAKNGAITSVTSNPNDPANKKPASDHAALTAAFDF